jgi:hypothetical protein
MAALPGAVEAALAPSPVKRWVVVQEARQRPGRAAIAGVVTQGLSPAASHSALVLHQRISCLMQAHWLSFFPLEYTENQGRFSAWGEQRGEQGQA